MGASQRTLKAWTQGAFYLLILALLASRAVSSNISHDENQFIAPGQFLAYDGLMPYVDYPYTHMPYAIPFYAVSALVSEYDLLAGRLLSVTFWFGSILLMVRIGRSLGGTSARGSGAPSWRRLAWEFVLVLALIQDAAADFVLRTALNHSMATFFSLLATLFFVRAVQEPEKLKAAAFWSGACISVAGLTRFNYASLIVVLFAGWLLYGLLRQQQTRKRTLLQFGTGVLIGSLPAIGLAALAPRHFYYGNIVYIRLNTVYYELILHRTGMSLASKLAGFASMLKAQPIEVVLYGVLLYTLVSVLVQARRDKEKLDIARLAIAALALTLWMTAFAPTPALLQYLAAPLPFMFILLEAIEIKLPGRETTLRSLGALALAAVVLAGLLRQNPVKDLALLAHPSAWPPVQVHELAQSLRELVPAGRVLGLQSSVPLEAGLDAYPFTATGPFSWRTSLLLTPERRVDYGVTSPEELPSVLEKLPPAAILVGFEEPNPGFARKDMGGLEEPFSQFATSNGYTAERLLPPFWPRGLTLWIRP